MRNEQTVPSHSSPTRRMNELAKTAPVEADWVRTRSSVVELRALLKH